MKAIIEAAFLYRMMLLGISEEDKEHCIALFFKKSTTNAISTTISTEYMDSKEMHRVIMESMPDNVRRGPHAAEACKEAIATLIEYLHGISDETLRAVIQEQIVAPAVKKECVRIATEQLEKWKLKAAKLFATKPLALTNSQFAWQELIDQANQQGSYINIMSNRSKIKNACNLIMFLSVVYIFVTLLRIVKSEDASSFKPSVSFMNWVLMPINTGIFLKYGWELVSPGSSVDIEKAGLVLKISFAKFVERHYAEWRYAQTQRPLARPAVTQSAPQAPVNKNEKDPNPNPRFVRNPGLFPHLSFFSSAAASAKVEVMENQHEFIYHNVRYIPVLDEKAMPPGKLDSIKKAFDKGFRERGGDRIGVTGIVPDDKDESSPFKITLSEEGRVKCRVAKDYIDADGIRVINLNFNLYDRHAHDQNRARFSSPSSAPTPGR